jgi:hypothetical protein
VEWKSRCGRGVRGGLPAISVWWAQDENDCSNKKMAEYEKPLHTALHVQIAMASTAKPPDPMPCALAAILLPESRAHGCHMQKTLFPGTYWVHTGECVLGPFLRAGWVRRGCAGVWAAAWVRIVGVRKGHPDHHKYTLRSRHW